MPLACSAAILAGGKSTRLSGKDKSKIVIGGVPIRDHLLALFRELFSEVFIITNTPLQHLDVDVNIATDILSIPSALTGIHTGLTYTSSPFLFVSACDTPFIKAELIAHILAQLASNVDAIVPKTADGYEPLCAVYAKRCLRQIETQLAQNRPTIRRLYDRVRLKEIPETELRAIDPELVSFFNINTPEDLKTATGIENDPLC